MTDMAAGSLRLFIIDDQPIVRWALRSFLETQSGMQVVGEAESVVGSVDLAEQRRPHVVVMNIDYPDRADSEAVAAFIQAGAHRSLAFTEHDTWDRVEGFMNAGGAGFVPKRAQLTELVEAIRAVAQGHMWISPLLRLVEPTGKDRDVDILTKRECETVRLIARGLTSRQIADQLCVSLKTIETHRYRIFRKLRIQRIAQLVDYAARHGLS